MSSADSTALSNLAKLLGGVDYKPNDIAEIMKTLGFLLPLDDHNKKVYPQDLKNLPNGYKLPASMKEKDLEKSADLINAIRPAYVYAMYNEM